MRVKVGNKWYEATADHPIAVELSDADKHGIGAMTSDQCIYAQFATRPRNEIERGGQIAWMMEGSRASISAKTPEDADNATQIGDICS